MRLPSEILAMAPASASASALEKTSVAFHPSAFFFCLVHWRLQRSAITLQTKSITPSFPPSFGSRRLTIKSSLIWDADIFDAFQQ